MKNLIDKDYKKAKNFITVAQLSYKVSKDRDEKSKNEVLGLINDIYGNVDGFYPIIPSFGELKDANSWMSYRLQFILEKVKGRKINKKEIYLKFRHLSLSDYYLTLDMVHWNFSIPCETKYSLKDYHKIPLVLKSFAKFLNKEVKTKRGHFDYFLMQALISLVYILSPKERKL